MKSYKWFILASYSFLVALNQLLWINFASISSQVQSYYGVSAFYVAFLAIIFPIVYIIFSIPSGIIVDRKGYKYSILLGSVIMFIFSLIRAIEINYILLLIGQIGIAIAQPLLNNSVSKLANTEFQMNEVTMAIGLGTLAIFIGVAAGMIVPPIIIEFISIQTMLYILSIVVLIAMLLNFLATRFSHKIESYGKTEIHFAKVIKFREIMILSYIAFVGMGIFNGILTWIDSIFQHVSISMLQAGEIGLSLVLGGIFGSIIIPYLSSKYGRRKIFVSIAIIVTIIILLIYMMIPNFIILVLLSLILGFFLLGAFPLIIDWATVITGSKYAGSATAVIWLLGQTGGFILPLLMGINFLTLPDNTYFVSFLIFAILIIPGFVLILKIQERRSFPHK